MSDHGDRRAAAVLLLLAVAGLGVRFAAVGDRPAGGVLYRPVEVARPSRDSVASRAARLARPLRPGERIDLDRATAEELTRLPRIGPGLAARIVADREARGPFGSLEALDRVAGVGPMVLDAVRPHAAFSAVRSGGGTAAPAPPGPRAGRPPVGPSARPPVRLNTATVEQLVQLPGIGAARAAAIVAERKARGPFRSLADLRARVAGIGPALVERLRAHVVVP